MSRADLLWLAGAGGLALVGIGVAAWAITVLIDERRHR